MPKTLTFLIEVTPAVEAFVTRYGAYFDNASRRWVVQGEVPVELASYIEKVRRPRDYIAQSTPQCPLCGCLLLLKPSKRGPFWSCSAFPSCKGARSLESEDADEAVNDLELLPVAEYIYDIDKNYKEQAFFSADLVDTGPPTPPSEAARGYSENLVRAQELYDRATGFFGSRALAINWLNAKKVGLGGRSPLEVMRTQDGCDCVESLLMQRFDETQ